MDGGLTTPPAPAAQDAGRSLRILLSAYVCRPEEGPEPGTGWRWAHALAQYGHDVWVLTRAQDRGAIEHALRTRPQPRLHFEYHALPWWARGPSRGERDGYLRHLLWQVGAYRVAREFCRRVRMDVIHHVNAGSFPRPTLLAFLDLPLVYGPVAGGDSVPRELRGTLPLRGCVGDLLRDAASLSARFDPLMAAVYSRSATVLCRTPEALRRIPARYHFKCAIQAEVGTDAPSWHVVRRRPYGLSPFRVLYVGRLVYRKGLHLGLMAFAMFRQTRPDARLTVVGSGPDEAWLRRIAWLLGIADAITWLPWTGCMATAREYQRHDAFLFPGLHDSRGNATLEALKSGLPVICLDVGGPAALVDSSCGIKVQPGDPAAVVEGLAAALEILAGDPARLQAMGEAAAWHAREDFSWPRQVSRMTGHYRASRSRHAPHHDSTVTMA